MKKHLLIVCFLFLSQLVSAQDTIVKMNNTRIVAKIIEINPKTVKYKKFSYPDGPLIIVERKQISRILYANGSVDTISVKPVSMANGVPKTDPRSSEFCKNYFTWVVSDAFFGMASFGFERILNNGKFSIKVPFSFNFRGLGMEDTLNQFTNANIGYNNNNTWDGSGYYYKYKTFSSGLEFYYYTGGQGTLRYFIGPCFEYGLFNYYYFHQISGAQPYPYDGYYEKKNGYYTAFFIKNGLIFQPLKNFAVSFNAGAGFFSPKTKYNDDYQYGPFESIDNALAIEFALNLGYKF